MEEPTERRSWHIGKEIPISVILGLAFQTAVLIWFSATQTAKLDNLTLLVSEFRASQYTQSDARRDQELQAARSSSNSRRIDGLERRVEILESRR